MKVGMWSLKTMKKKRDSKAHQKEYGEREAEID